MEKGQTLVICPPINFLICAEMKEFTWDPGNPEPRNIH